MKNDKLSQGDMIYYGETADSRPNGIGIKFQSGIYYIGRFDNGTLSGFGKYIEMLGGGEYIGDLSFDEPEGYGKKLTSKNNYMGIFKNGALAYGRKEYPNGRIYIGGIKDGIPEGEGVMIYAEDETEYKEWDNEECKYKRHPLTSRTRYGIWSDDSLIEEREYTKEAETALLCPLANDSTEGILPWQGGAYVGDTENGVPHGRGYWLSSGNIRALCGIFEHGLLTDGGTVYLEGDSVRCYFGEFKCGIPHGRGSLIYGNGDEWNGGFDMGKKIFDSSSDGIANCVIVHVKEYPYTSYIEQQFADGVMAKLETKILGSATSKDIELLSHTVGSPLFASYDDDWVSRRDLGRPGYENPLMCRILDGHAIIGTCILSGEIGGSPAPLNDDDAWRLCELLGAYEYKRRTKQWF